MHIIILTNKFKFFHWFVDVPAGIAYVFQMLHISLDDTCEICACIKESELPHTPHLALETSQPKYSLEQMQCEF